MVHFSYCLENECRVWKKSKLDKTVCNAEFVFSAHMSIIIFSYEDKIVSKFFTHIESFLYSVPDLTGCMGNEWRGIPVH